MKIAISGRIQTGSYTNRDGQKVYTTEVVVEDQEFAESKNAVGNSGNSSERSSGNSSAGFDSRDGFMDAPSDEELPFN